MPADEATSTSSDELTAVAISNPGFESDFSAWTEVEPTAISSSAHTGSKSAKLSSSTGQIKRTITGLASNTTYTLSAWVLGSAKLGARNFGSSEKSTTQTASSWTQATVTFTTGSSNTSAEIFAAWASGGDARVDDFTLGAGSTSSGGGTSNPPPSGCSYPAQLLNLKPWKLTLPIGSPTEIKQLSLATYTIDPWFKVNSACNGVQFRAHTSGSTTDGSGYPRSELREMTSDGSSTFSWSTSSGTHTLYVDQAITAVPKGKKHVVAGQIHDKNDDVIVIRLEYPKLFVDVNGSAVKTLTSSYVLGTRFNFKFVAGGGQIKVYYNGSLSPVYTLSKSVAECYFKAGAYTQSNCDTESEYGQSCSTSNYGEVQIYGLTVTHQ